jgi:hypothetical protein
MQKHDTTLAFEPAKFRHILQSGFAASKDSPKHARLYEFNTVVCGSLATCDEIGSFARRTAALEALVLAGHLGPKFFAPASADGQPALLDPAVIDLAAVFPLGADHRFNPAAFIAALEEAS